MKKNLEDVFKEKLSNYEAPYDAGAWEQFSAKLAGRSVGGSSTLKWVAASVGIAAVLTSVYLLTPTPETAPLLASEDPVELSAGDGQESIKQRQPSEEPAVTQEKQPVAIHTKETTQVNNSSQRVKPVMCIEPLTTDTEIENTLTEAPIPSTEKEVGEKPVANSPEHQQLEKKQLFITGSISSQTICAGEPVQVTNRGEANEHVRVLINGDIYELSSGKSITIDPAEHTEIHYLNEELEIVATESLHVLAVPSSNFSHNSDVFEEGLPVLELNAYGSFKSYEWQVNGESLAAKSSSKIHLFQKGDYDVKLIATDYNGCRSTHQRTVTISEDYNLLAVSAFRPNGTDYRNRSFMPFALTQRETPFTLMIIDPRDHSVIYSTKDANSPWDGIDQRTGKMTPGETTYIWKVQLEQPLPNEKPLYVGTIIHD